MVRALFLCSFLFTTPVLSQTKHSPNKSPAHPFIQMDYGIGTPQITSDIGGATFQGARSTSLSIQAGFRISEKAKAFQIGLGYIKYSVNYKSTVEYTTPGGIQRETTDNSIDAGYFQIRPRITFMGSSRISPFGFIGADLSVPVSGKAKSMFLPAVGIGMGYKGLFGCLSFSLPLSAMNKAETSGKTVSVKPTLINFGLILYPKRFR